MLISGVGGKVSDPGASSRYRTSVGGQPMLRNARGACGDPYPSFIEMVSLHSITLPDVKVHVFNKD